MQILKKFGQSGSAAQHWSVNYLQSVRICS